MGSRLAGPPSGYKNPTALRHLLSAKGHWTKREVMAFSTESVAVAVTFTKGLHMAAHDF